MSTEWPPARAPPPRAWIPLPSVALAGLVPVGGRTCAPQEHTPMSFCCRVLMELYFTTPRKRRENRIRRTRRSRTLVHAAAAGTRPRGDTGASPTGRAADPGSREQPPPPGPRGRATRPSRPSAPQSSAIARCFTRKTCDSRRLTHIPCALVDFCHEIAGETKVPAEL